MVDPSPHALVSAPAVETALPPVTHVAIEATRFLQERRGIGRYLRETVLALLAPMLQLDHRWWKVVKRFKYARRYRRTVATADWLLTDADFTRQELVRRVGAAGHAISVAPLAADDPGSLDTPAIRPDVAAVGGRPFFLTVGGQDGRKNLGRVYDAMDRLWTDGCDIPLVQCGPPPSAETRRRHGAPWLTHLGYVNEGELVALYRQATALVYPSRYEGFGLPVLEAMRWGAPVICADAASLPEVAGNAALYVPWRETAALAEAMARCARSDALRATLRERGRVQAARFSWARTARLTYEGFQRARQRRWQRAQQ